MSVGVPHQDGVDLAAFAVLLHPPSAYRELGETAAPDERRTTDAGLQMSDESVTQTPTVFSSKERATLVAKALSEAARRARFSTKRRRSLTGGGFRARRGERLFKLIRLWSFIGVVLVPSLVTAVYFGLIAADQYVSEARFTVRGGMPPSLQGKGENDNAPMPLIIQDTQIIMNYIQSRAMVEALSKTVDFEKLYQQPSVDYFSRLGTDEPIEKVVKYWNRHIDVSVQLPSGIVVLGVRAFSPGDAVKVANAVVESSEQLVNQMNDQMKADAVGLAETERTRAMAHVVKARADLEAARNEEGMLSADVASTAVTGLITTVQTEMLKMQQEFDSQRRFVSATAPQMRNLQSKIDAAKQQIAKLQAQMTQAKASTGKDKVLSGSMSRLDYARLENEIAERIYAGSLVALERARLASEVKLMYLNTFVQPVAAEEAKYPRRALIISLFAVASLAVWGVVMALMNLVRGNMG